MSAATRTDESLARFRVELYVAPVDAALHRVLAACHRRRLTIDNLRYTRSSSTDQILMELFIAPSRAHYITNVLQREPLVICCTAAPVEPPAGSLSPFRHCGQ
jgi:hypothetical protein